MRQPRFLVLRQRRIVHIGAVAWENLFQPHALHTLIVNSRFPQDFVDFLFPCRGVHCTNTFHAFRVALPRYPGLFQKQFVRLCWVCCQRFQPRLVEHGLNRLAVLFDVPGGRHPDAEEAAHAILRLIDVVGVYLKGALVECHYPVAVQA